MPRMLICLAPNQSQPGKSNPDCKKSSVAQYHTPASHHSSDRKSMTDNAKENVGEDTLGRKRISSIVRMNSGLDIDTVNRK